MSTDETKIHEILVCKGPECGDRRFAGDLAVQFRTLIKARGLEERVKLDRYCCFGRCQSGPNVMTREIEPGQVALYVAPGPGSRLHLGVSPRDVAGILDGLGDPAATGRPLETAPAREVLARRGGSRDD